MSNTWSARMTRRRLLKTGGALAVAGVGAGLLPRWAGPVLQPVSDARAAALTVQKFRHLAATDGWVHLPGTVMSDPANFGSLTQLSPDSFAPAGLTTYIFGFRDLTKLSATSDTPAVLSQKGHAQTSAPQMYFDEGDTIQIILTNLGLQQRPDLVDSHTIHWHGFRNAIPLFDGVPEMAISVPIGSDFPYFYHPTDPGTYMYHCHFEDVEHVQMGMDGIIFVRPAQNKTGNGAGAPVARYNLGASAAPLGYVYNDGVALSDPRSTAYDREYGIFLSEFWATSHYDDAHVQNADWSDYHADFYLMNGRCYPDTLAPNGGGINTSTGFLIAPGPRPDLQYQPLSSLVQCRAGERVLLRFVNLGYNQASMRLTGIRMHVVGKDATPLRGIGAGGLRNGADTSYLTSTVYLGAGESYDAIFTAPPHVGPGYDTYLLYNNQLGHLQTAGGGTGIGGQMTEVRVYAANTPLLPQQTAPNDADLLFP